MKRHRGGDVLPCAVTGRASSSARTLADRDIVVAPRIGRRSSLSVLGILSTALLGGPAAAQVTDRDASDPGGRGRGCPGWSDSDPADVAGCGRRTGLTDQDATDQARRGRGRGSCSDRDPADPPGRGRRC
jgi:hypothetical protein